MAVRVFLYSFLDIGECIILVEKEMGEMKNSVLVTITGLAHYYGTKPFKVGAVIKLKKEYDNKYDDEAIRAQLPYIGTVGYVANSTYTVYSGTYSAGRLYDKIGECACAKIILITHSSAVAEVIEGCPSENMGGCVFE